MTTSMYLMSSKLYGKLTSWFSRKVFYNSSSEHDYPHAGKWRFHRFSNKNQSKTKKNDKCIKCWSCKSSTADNPKWSIRLYTQQLIGLQIEISSEDFTQLMGLHPHKIQLLQGFESFDHSVLMLSARVDVLANLRCV